MCVCYRQQMTQREIHEMKQTTLTKKLRELLSDASKLLHLEQLEKPLPPRIESERRDAETQLLTTMDDLTAYIEGN